MLTFDPRHQRRRRPLRCARPVASSSSSLASAADQLEAGRQSTSGGHGQREGRVASEVDRRARVASVRRWLIQAGSEHAQGRQSEHRRPAERGRQLGSPSRAELVSGPQPAQGDGAPGRHPVEDVGPDAIGVGLDEVPIGRPASANTIVTAACSAAAQPGGAPRSPRPRRPERPVDGVVDRRVGAVEAHPPDDRGGVGVTEKPGSSSAMPSDDRGDVRAHRADGVAAGRERAHAVERDPAGTSS